MNDNSNSDSNNKSIYGIGGTVCMIFIGYSLLTMVLLLILGQPPRTVEECFMMLRENRLIGLLRLDLLTDLILPLYYLLFFSLYLALKKTGHGLLTVSTILVFAGLTLVLSTPSAFSLLDLGDKFSHAASDIQRNKFLAAGESIIASDMWHSTGAFIGGLLLQSGALFISIIMLKSNVFIKLTAVTGIVTHGLDLLHIIIGFFLPSIGAVLISIAGILYLLWFPLTGLGLFKLAKNI